MIDTNLYLSRWPARRLPLDKTFKLVAKLKQLKVTQAWAGSFDCLLHKDIGTVNTRLVEQCKKHGDGLLVPFGSINPTLPDWQEEIRRCVENYKMPGIRLHPNYHGYQLDDKRFAELLSLAEKQHLIVQLALKMEDERTQHPLLQVKSVEVKPLAGLVKKLPQLRLVILNGLRSLQADTLETLSAAGKVYFDIAMLEGVGGIERLLKSVPIKRILFGSYAPFFYPESAQLKLRESELPGLAVEAISQKNAQQLLKPRSQ